MASGVSALVVHFVAEAPAVGAPRFFSEYACRGFWSSQRRDAVSLSLLEATALVDWLNTYCSVHEPARRHFFMVASVCGGRASKSEAPRHDWHVGKPNCGVD